MFHGGAVLQRGQTVSVWGLSTARTVTLTLAAAKNPGGGQAVTVSGVVNSSGVWLVWLPPQPAAYNRTLTARDSAGSAEVVVSFGEAVLCVGQRARRQASPRRERTHVRRALELCCVLSTFVVAGRTGLRCGALH